ncbi:MAG: ATP-binding protein [Smithellaceae bacterium]
MPESLRILILEDSPADAELVLFELKEAGFVFTSKVVMEEKDFVREIQEFRPDLILSDYDLPRYNGALALVVARRSCPDTPFILVTGAVTEDRAIEILTQGAKDYVLKSRLAQRLAPAVQRALAEAEEHRARKQAEAELRESHRTLEEKVRIRTAELEAEIAARKKTDDDLRRSEERQRLVLEASSLGTFEVDLLTDEGQWNATEFELLGLKPGDVKASPDAFFRYVHPDDIRQLQSDWEEATRTGKLDSEFRIVRVDGRERWLAGKGSFIFDGHPDGDGTGTKGIPRRFMGVNFDITRRKEVEETLRESEERFRVAQELSPDGFAILRPVRDSEGRIVDFTFVYENAAIARINGTDPAAVVGRRLSEFLPAHSQSPFHEAHAHVADTGETCIMERKYDGGDIPRPTWFRVVVVRTGQDIAILSQDITERKQAEEAMKIQARQTEEANKELESFSYSVSHDLRAPLRAIDAFSRKLEREYKDKVDENFAATINVIRSNTKAMGNLIEDLLSFSKVQKTGMSMAIIDMHQLAAEVWNDILDANKQRALKFKAGKILPGYGDRVLIRQVLFNLLSNAVKFTKDRKPGIIEISSYGESGKIVYCVKDNGAGFDMSYYDKLFGVFQRLHGREEFEGTGIGLAIVQRIVKRHGGDVWAEGKVDQGATFYFTLSTQKE